MKPWMIFLHGLLGASRNWLRVVRDFESDYQILNFDQRGHGHGFKPATGYAPSDFAEDLHNRMEQAGISSAILVGHSMGGRNALTFAHRWPEKVRALVIEDIGPIRTYENGQKLVDNLARVPVPFADRSAAKSYFFGEFGDPRLGSFLYTHMAETPGGFTWDFPLSMVEEIVRKGREQDLWPAINGLRCPTLWIRGSESRELTAEEFTKVVESNPVIHGVEIPGTGHWVHFEKPTEFVRAIKDFIRSANI